MRLVLLTLLALYLLPAADAQQENIEARLRALLEVRLDGERAFRVRDLFLEREDVKFYFTDGYLIFAEPVAGRETAALFVAVEPSDEGELLVIPPDAAERQSVARYTGGSTVLNEKFRSALMLFSDDTGAQLAEGLAAGPPREPDEQGNDLAVRWTPVLRNILEGVSLRLLNDLLAPPEAQTGFFAAAVGGGRLGRFDVVVDKRSETGGVSIGQTVWRDGERYYETWCRFEARSVRQGRQPPTTERLEDYRIDADLGDDLSMDVVAAATFVAGGAPGRATLLELSRRLEVSSVQAGGQPVEFLQLNQSLVSAAAQRQNNVVLVAFPEAPKPGARIPLEFRYRGRVVADAGNGVYYVGSRGTWYPSSRLNFSRFELRFRYPAALDLVATGALAESSEEGGRREALFRAESPVRMAGFNLGQYVSAARQVGPYELDVRANRAVEASLAPRLIPPVLVVEPTLDRRRRPDRPTAVLVQPTTPEPLRPADRIEAVASSSAAALEFFAERFGPPPLARTVISPIPASFGQGFPGLVYASTRSYFRASDPPLAGLPEEDRLFFAELLLPHEISHQWWGNLVAVDRAEDVWIAEALATYSSLLWLEQRQGAAARNRVLALYRRRLLERNAEGDTVESAGPIVMGERLQTSRFPTAHRVIVYEKGAWIIHMLRGAMGDEHFFRFLRALPERYAFRSINSEQLREAAASFLPAEAADPSLRGFFDQWVYGMGIPRYTATIRSEKGGDRLVLLQSGVPDYFTAEVPLEIELADGGRLERRVRTEGPRTAAAFDLPTKPVRVVVDPRMTLLAATP